MDRFKDTKKAGIIGIIGNMFLLIIKASIGFLTNSQAMIADSFNSAGDIFASAMTFIGNKIASEPKDDSHNYGHGKAEYIFSFFISLSMIVVAGRLLYSSINSLVNKDFMTFSWWLVLVCIVTIIVKLSLYLYTNKLCKKYNNILLEANSKDHRNDCVVTTFTLISVVASIFGIYWLDGVVGIGISAWIAITGVRIFIESYNVLMDKSLDDDTKNLIASMVKSSNDIKEITSFNTIPVGYEYMVVLTITVDGNMSTFDSHKLADSLETKITKLDKIYNTVIHVNPI